MARINAPREVIFQDVREGESVDTLSAFTARLDLTSAAAGRTITATTTRRTSRLVPEYDDILGKPFARSFSFSVTNGAISVAWGVTIGTGLGGHTAPAKAFSDSGLVLRHGQDETGVEGTVGRRPMMGAPPRRDLSAISLIHGAIHDETPHLCHSTRRSC